MVAVSAKQRAVLIEIFVARFASRSTRRWVESIVDLGVRNKVPARNETIIALSRLEKRRERESRIASHQ